MSNPTVLLTLRTSLYLQQTAHAYMKGRLLDAGCGTKPYLRLFSELVEDWVGLDARAVGDVMGYIEENDIPDEEFDTVLCTNVVHLCPDPQIAVAELARMVKPGGHVIVTFPCLSSGGRYSFTPDCARELVERAGLKVIDHQTVGGLFADEFEAFLAWGRYSVAIPKELHGFIQHLDRTYPLMSAVVARKEEGCQSST